ncbi:head-tail connector protein [Sphingopyxis sp. NJF-3]
MSVSLEMAKEQIRVTHDDEDGLIASYIVAANAWLVRYCGDNYDPYAPELEQAELLLVSHWYENRSTVDSGNVIPREIPFSVEALAGPFRLPTIV